MTTPVQRKQILEIVSRDSPLWREPGRNGNQPAYAICGLKRHSWRPAQAPAECHGNFKPEIVLCWKNCVMSAPQNQTFEAQKPLIPSAKIKIGSA